MTIYECRSGGTSQLMVHIISRAGNAPTVTGMVDGANVSCTTLSAPIRADLYRLANASWSYPTRPFLPNLIASIGNYFNLYSCDVEPYQLVSTARLPGNGSASVTRNQNGPANEYLFTGLSGYFSLRVDGSVLSEMGFTQAQLLSFRGWMNAIDVCFGV